MKNAVSRLVPCVVVCEGEVRLRAWACHLAHPCFASRPNGNNAGRDLSDRNRNQHSQKTQARSGWRGWE
jgi:hypothetical protein